MTQEALAGARGRGADRGTVGVASHNLVGGKQLVFVWFLRTVVAQVGGFERQFGLGLR